MSRGAPPGNALPEAAWEAVAHLFMVNFMSTRTPVFAVFLCKTAPQLAGLQIILLHGHATLPENRQCPIPARSLLAEMHFFNCSLNFQTCLYSWSTNNGSDDWQGVHEDIFLQYTNLSFKNFIFLCTPATLSVTLYKQSPCISACFRNYGIFEQIFRLKWYDLLF